MTYPASYYTGPLGNRNPLPSKAGAFLIDFYRGGDNHWASARAGIEKREQDIGRKFDGIQVHYGGEGLYMGVNNCIAPDRVEERAAQWIHDRGELPVVSWTPTRTIADINAGLVDQCIRNAANHFKSFDSVIMLRIFGEFDIQQWTHHACGQPLIDAWRRVVGLFQKEGATNVGFWWVPNEGVDRACVNASYPGDAYVDWVGSDWYNWCNVGDSQCWSDPFNPGWAEFNRLFDYTTAGSFTSQHDLWGPRKPFVIAETGTIVDPGHTSKKGDWFRAIPAAAKQMKYLRGISFYDQDVSSVEGPRANFRVDHPVSDPSVYAGFKQMANDSWFNTR